jgi:hypothetical protein
MCAREKSMSTSINMITMTGNEHKMEWGDSVVLWPHRGGSRRRGDLR